MSNFHEGEHHWPIMGTRITNFHRALSTCVQEFLEFRAAGFANGAILEPSVDVAGLQAWPELADELRVPNFIIYVLSKGAGTSP